MPPRKQPAPSWQQVNQLQQTLIGFWQPQKGRITQAHKKSYMREIRTQRSQHYLVQMRWESFYND